MIVFGHWQTEQSQRHGSGKSLALVMLAAALLVPFCAAAQGSSVIPLNPLISAGASPRGAAQQLQIDPLERIVGSGAAGYTLNFSRTIYPDLNARLEAASALKQLEARPPRTAAGLRRRMARDEEALEKVLRSQGFYAGQVAIRLGRTRGNGAAESLRVEVAVEPGPEFLLSAYDVLLEGREAQRLPARDFGIDDLPLEPGSRADADGIVSNQERLIVELANGGYPFARVLDRQILVDHARRAVEVALTVQPGVRSRLGDVNYRGLQRVDPAYVTRQLGLEPGRIYSQAEIDAAKDRLLATGLFSSVTIDQPASPTEGNSVPITLNFRERAAQQVRAGIALSSLNGPSAFAEYQHRNLLGEGQSILLRTEIALDEQIGRLSFRWPDVFDNKIDFIADLEASYRDQQSVTAVSIEGLLALERRFNQDRTKVRFGIGAEWLDERSSGVTSQDYLFLSTPLSLDSDFSNDRFDPSKGFRLSGSATPFIDVKNPELLFYDVEGRVSGYQKLPIGKDVVLAGWAGARAIFGEDLANIPRSKRIFAGGQGSVRVFDRNSISPRNSAGSAGTTGGLGLVEGGAEIRTRLAERFGAVAFAEGAVIAETPLFDDLDRPFIGAGLGARYYSPLGPIRLDLGLPVTEEIGWRDIQLNVGLGQAF